MSRRRLRLVADGSTLASGFAAIRAELDLPAGFTDEVLAAADASSRRGAQPEPELDATDLPFVTVDPPGSLDLDQALHLQRRTSGFRLSYAIADVGAFVNDGDPVDVEARRRVETIYSPDTRTPLHPEELSEGAASLLPGQLRPAVLWQLDLDADGQLTQTRVFRARVRSRARLSYDEAQKAIDAEHGDADDSLRLLPVVGELRQRIERERGGVDLGRPEQEVVPRDGGWTLQYRATLPVEAWNAQLSLLTGMAAAGLMVTAKVGVLRTMPAPVPADIDRLRRTARGLGIEWPAEVTYAELVHGLDARRDNHVAFLAEATVLLRGAGYTAFDGSLPAQLQHSAVAAPYAHATAPLRRLVDRFVSEVCLAVAAGAAVPADVRAALPLLPDLMADGDRRASALERACVDLVEAAVLAPYVGRQFTGVVVDVRGATANRSAGGVVQLTRPAVLGFCEGQLPLGQRVTVRLIQADVAQRQVRFELLESE
jgi:VacB/RNase II family 3'-5' exoribonuclease